MAIRRPLVVIAGPTASGKTRLSIQLAKRYDGEIISADSRAIYRGLSIGTAKPSAEEQQGVPHWGIDLVDPDERFTAADFQKYANAKISEIRDRGHLPILVGGTGLYVDSVLYNFEFPRANLDVAQRAKLDTQTIEELHIHCLNNNISLPENNKNKRYVINTIIRNGRRPKRRSRIVDNTIVVGISTEKFVLDERIQRRAETILDGGVIEETLKVAAKFGWESAAMTGNIYPLIHQYIDGILTKDELLVKFAAKDRQLAKRQRTWLRRDEHIYWTSLDDAYTYIAHRLAEVNKLW